MSETKFRLLNLVPPAVQKPVALALAFAAGWGAEDLGVPLGWMIGSLFMVGMLSLSGLKLKVPSILRWAVMAVIGIYLGASFTPDVIRWLPRAIVSVAGMFLTVAIEAALATFLMIKVMRCSFFTAYTSCVPGGFSSMAMIAQEHGGDVEVVSIVQLVRLVVVLCSISLAARYFGVVTQGQIGGVDYNFITEDLMFGVAVVLVGLGAGIFFRFPIFCMLFPMLIAAGFQVTELTDLQLPGGPLAIALVVLGASVGAHWGSFRSDKFLKCLGFGFFLALFLLVFSAAAAWLVASTIFLELAPTLLAYSPGGVSEISLIAVALDIEPALVGLHHVLRVLFIFLTLPVVLYVATNRIDLTKKKKEQVG